MVEIWKDIPGYESEYQASNWGTRNKRSGDKRRGIKRPEVSEKLSKPVLQYTINMEFVKEWKSAIDCQLNGMGSCGHITECCNGMRPKYKGYIWRYKNGREQASCRRFS